MSHVPQKTSPTWKERPPTPRWKEWLPLVTQQQRLRSLIQVSAYNTSWHPGSSLYFTLHQTRTSPRFFTSECLQHVHPKWGEMDLSSLAPPVNTSATGLVIRLWLRHEQQSRDELVLVWGVYFSGLVYIGPRLTANASSFKENAIVFHMRGGYFTDRHSLVDLPSNALVRNLSIQLPPGDLRPSYSVSLLLRLRNIQQAIRKMSQQSMILRQKIEDGAMSSEDASIMRETNPTIRRLLSKGRPKPLGKKESMTLLCQVEMLRFRVALLRQEKSRKLALVESLERQRDAAISDNTNHSCELTDKYQNLHKEVERLRDKRQPYIDLLEEVCKKNNQLCSRRKQLMSQLALIYPVTLTDGRYKICDVHLPNSEELTKVNDRSVASDTSVALGFVAHLVQMVSVFLQVPLRYPIKHFGSRSKIVDHISVKIPDQEREFPLFSQGKDKLHFLYGVYLLNKNIAQLRWLVGFPTNDLSATLHNVYHLLHFNQFTRIENHNRSMSGSSLDVPPSSGTVSPVGSFFALSSSHGTTDHNSRIARQRSSKSTGSTEHLFPVSKRSGSFLSSPLYHHSVMDSLVSSSNLSYSLDKGLDEYKEIERSEDAVSIGKNISPSSTSNLASIGSDPTLVIHSHINSMNGKDHLVSDLPSAEEICDKPPEMNNVVNPLLSLDSDASESEAGTNVGNMSEFTLVTERLAELVDSSLQLDFPGPSPDEKSNEAKEELAADQVACDTKGSRQSRNEHDPPQEYPEEHHPRAGASSHQDTFSFKEAQDEIEVDVGTDALVVLGNGEETFSHDLATESTSQSKMNVIQESSESGKKIFCDIVRSPEECDQGFDYVGVEESVLVDNLFASVASRTEALANQATSFNLMSSRHGST